MKFHTATLHFLDAIAEHNSRDFFATVRPLYDEIRVSLHDIAAAMITQIATYDCDISGLEVKECLFRIYRDARRLAPGDQIYKHNRGIVLSPGGKNSSLPGYYLHIEPGNKSFFAAGVYRPLPAHLLALRKSLLTDGETYKKLSTTKKFHQYFGTPQGTTLTRPPKGFSHDDPHIDLIMKKQHLIYRPISDDELMQVDIVAWMDETARVAYPRIQWLRDVSNKK